jgi:hypothetical protein
MAQPHQQQQRREASLDLGSMTRLPYRPKNQSSTRGIATINPIEATAKGNSHHDGVMNSRLSAVTVPSR